MSNEIIMSYWNYSNFFIWQQNYEVVLVPEINEFLKNKEVKIDIDCGDFGTGSPVFYFDFINPEEAKSFENFIKPYSLYKER